jgi:long-chain acyl-CoA synthetase
MKESIPENWPKWVPHSINYPKIPLYQILDESAKKYPENIAIIFQDKKITYRELEKEVNSFATGLQKQGLAKNNRVAIYLPNIPQFIISYYGALKAGAIVTSICPLFKERELKHQLIDSGADTIIILDLFYPLFEKIKHETVVKRVRVTSIKDYLPPLKRIIGSILGKIQSHDIRKENEVHYFKELIGYLPDLIDLEFDPVKDLALLQYTGGTTGLPKGAMLTHYNLVSNAYMCNAWYGAEEGKEIYLNVIPFYHIFGMTATMNNAVASASTMILIPRFDIIEVLKSIEKYKATVFSGVATLYSALVNHSDIKNYDLTSLNFCICGASAIPPEIQKQFMEMSGSVLVEGYGLTEASPVTHANPMDPTFNTVKTGSIGFTWPDTQAKIVDSISGEDLSIGEAGELIVKGPQVMRGYWNMPEETMNALRDGWLYTGDIARRDDEGYFYLVDRAKDLIKYKGHSVYPREIEDVLYEHPAVKLCAVVGIPDEISGENPKAFIVLKDDVEASEEEVIQFVKDRVAAYKRIRSVEFRDELPMSPVMKILRRILRDEAIKGK